jgi:hypothetical protein
MCATVGNVRPFLQMDDGSSDGVAKIAGCCREQLSRMPGQAAPQTALSESDLNGLTLTNQLIELTTPLQACSVVE